MRKAFLPLLLLALPPLLSAADTVSKRLSGLEKRVTSVEKRVSRLEGGAQAAPDEPAAARKEAPPISVVFLKKRQVVGTKVGIMLYLELENVSRRRLYAFNGTLMFRDENGALVWSKAYGYSEPLAPGDKVEATLAVSSEQTREYLRLLKARALTVTLEKLEVYGAD